MKSREKIAHDYLVFRYPTEYVLVFFPIMVGVIINIFSAYFDTPAEAPRIDYFVTRQFNSIDNFLLGSKITMVILIAFFICYRWASMLNDGSYGFWLTTGVVRRSFYVRTILKFASLMIFSQLVGLSLVFYQSNVVLENDEYLALMLGMVSNIFFIIVISVYLANRMKNPEFASITYITILGVNFAFNTSTFLFNVFQADLAFRSGQDAILGSIVSLAISLIIAFLTIRAHIAQDIEI